LTERKHRLRAIMPTVECRLLYLDSIAERGIDLYRAACKRDLEGIVAKWSRGTYQTDGRGTSWLKIKNPE
jgi:ATP-dependent DNA ligase